MLYWKDIISIRMERLFLNKPVKELHYDQLFTDMSPVPTRYWTSPGDPPTLPAHTDFDDYDYNYKLRAMRDLLKGRFAGGSIAYVRKEDLEVLACLYKKEIGFYNPVQAELITLLEQEGPMTIQQIKELTGLMVKEITPQLHKLQEAFLIYEDQIDNEGDRGWYLFESEFPDINITRYSKLEALKLVLPRAARLLVFFDEELLKSYYKVPLKLVREAINELIADGSLVSIEIEGRLGYLLKEDKDFLYTNTIHEYSNKVMLLQRNDFLVRAYADSLKNTFISEWDALYYILVDGEFHGAVVGRFKFGPHIIEDIVLDLAKEVKLQRQEEILEAVYEIFDRDQSPAKRYDGKLQP